MTLRELRAEYQTEIIGPAILEEVRRACASRARRYPPVVYARSPSWDSDTIEELVQDVVVERLLGEHQLAYLFDVADRLSDWRALLNRQIKITLARRRVRTVVDNLLVRARRYLGRAEGVETGTSAGYTVFRRIGAQGPYRALTDREVREVAEYVRVVARRRPGSGERAPAVYSEVALEAVLDIMLYHAGGGIAIRDIGRILEFVLTDWVPAVLELDEGGGGSAAVALSPEEAAEVMAIAAEIIFGLSKGDGRILRGRLAGLPDTEVARRIGVSRPTLIKRRRALIDRIRAASENLAPTGQERLMDELALAIAIPRNEEQS